MTTRQSYLKSIYWALSSALITIFCAVVSAIILVVSDKQRVDTWKIQPNVLLALLSSASNTCLALALTVGVAVCWWRKALHGTTAATLHYIWERGMGVNFFSALFAGFDVNKVVAVTVLVAVAKFIGNALLQRATAVQAHDNIMLEKLKLDIVQTIPDGWMGIQEQDDWDQFITPSNVINTKSKWWRNDTIVTLNQSGYFCDGTCEGIVTGAGVSYNCTSVKKTVDLSKDDSGTVLFATNSTMHESSTGNPILLLTVLYISAIDDNCHAEEVVQQCWVMAAQSKYPLIIRNDTITFDQGKLLSMEIASIYNSPGDLLNTSRGTGLGPLKGLHSFLHDLFFSRATLRFRTSTNAWFYDGPGTLQDLFYEGHSKSPRSENCTLNWKWSSPVEYLLKASVEFMFLTSLDVGSTLKDTQVFDVMRTQRWLVFHTDYSYLAGALVAILVPLVGVISLLWGWWELGRSVSLSPLETAKAFRAPLIHNIDESDASGILGKFGDTRVQYDGEYINSIELQTTGGCREEIDLVSRNSEETSGSEQLS
jgi:hypothetical protein